MNSKTSIPVFYVATAVYYTSSKVSTAVLVNGLITLLAAFVVMLLSSYSADPLYVKISQAVVILSCAAGLCMFVVNCVLRILAEELMRKARYDNEES
jgi:uncharacterized membrane protein YvlD (DUF360 family)